MSAISHSASMPLDLIPHLYTKRKPGDKGFFLSISVNVIILFSEVTLSTVNDKSTRNEIYRTSSHANYYELIHGCISHITVGGSATRSNSDVGRKSKGLSLQL